MAISAERLASVDEELAGLGRSDDQIEAVLVRFEDREPEDLAAVDEQLARLGADVTPVASEPVLSEPPDTSSSGALSADELFGDSSFGEERASAPDLAAMFDEARDEEEPATVDSPPEDVGLAESLEAELEGIAAAAAGAEQSGGDTQDGPTSLLTSDEVEAIQDDASASAPAPAEARRSSHPPRDPDFDALLGDDEQVFRPSQQPPAADAQADGGGGDEGDFELLVDEDIMLVEDEDLDVDGPPAAEAAGEDQPTVEEEPEDGEGEPKKGFFKKLFGGNDG